MAPTAYAKSESPASSSGAGEDRSAAAAAGGGLVSAPRPGAALGKATGGAAADASSWWAPRLRQCTGELAPPPLAEKPSLKVLEHDIARQVQLCYYQTQQDLDLLHAQLLSDVRVAVTQELRCVEQSMLGLRGELAEVLGAEVRDLRSQFDRARAAASAELEDRVRDSLCEAEALTERAVGLASEALQTTMQQEVRKLREESSAAEGRLAETVAEGWGKLKTRLESCVTKAALADGVQKLVQPQFQDLRAGLAESRAATESLRPLFESLRAGAVDRAEVERLLEDRQPVQAGLGVEDVEELIARRTEGLLRQEDVVEVVDSRVEGLIDRTTLEYCTSDIMDEVARRIEVARGEPSEGEQRLAQAVALCTHRTEAAYEELRGLVEGEAGIGQARFRETQAAVADLEGRVERRLAVQLRRLDEDLRAATASTASEALEVVARRVDSAQAGWVRQVEWTAEIDPELLKQQGRITVESPRFAAACLTGLRLRLRVAQSKKHGWVYGAFLSAPRGTAAFRLEVDGTSEDFTANFGLDCPEMGSQKVAVHAEIKHSVQVRLFLFNVTVPLTEQLGWPAGLRGSAAVVDTAQAAAREAQTLRSSMIRRVEWRISQVAQHIAAAKAARSDEVLEPLISPPFSAGGLDGLQLRFYPTGYRAQTDGSCGLFLLCPPGIHIKCKAFVGDVVKVFENTFEEREPYGRGSFCRLADKLAEDGSLVCGIELLEVRNVLTAEIKGGPFGNVEDQVTVLTGLAGGMDVVRQLRDAAGARAVPRAAAPRPAALLGAPPPAMFVSKSLPLLAGGGDKAAFVAAIPLRQRRQIDDGIA